MGDSAPEVLGFQAFAQRIMRAPSYVTQLRKAGRLVLSADGKGVLVAESIKLIADTSDPSRAGVQARHAAQREAGGATATPPPATGRHGGEAHDPAPFGDDPHSKRRSKALADKGVKFQAISTSEIKISVLIDAAYAELAVRALHSAYGLETV